MDYISDLHKLCETLGQEIKDITKKVEKNDGKMSAGDLEAVDKLTHSIKSIKTTIAMMEAEGEGGEGYSGHYMMPYYGRSYRGEAETGMDGRPYRGNSYARNARRDSMGRYSREGYSRAGDLADRLYTLMEEAPNEHIKGEFRRLAEKIEEQM